MSASGNIEAERRARILRLGLHLRVKRVAPRRGFDWTPAWQGLLEDCRDKRMSQASTAEQLGIHPTTLRKRIRALEWTWPKANMIPPKRMAVIECARTLWNTGRLTKIQVAAEVGISPASLAGIAHRHGFMRRAGGRRKGAAAAAMAQAHDAVA